MHSYGSICVTYEYDGHRNLDQCVGHDLGDEIRTGEVSARCSFDRKGIDDHQRAEHALVDSAEEENGSTANDTLLGLTDSKEDGADENGDDDRLNRGDDHLRFA